MKANTELEIDIELRQWCTHVAKDKNPVMGVNHEAKKLYEWLKPHDWRYPAPKEHIEDFELRKWCARNADADDPIRQFRDEEKKLYEWVTTGLVRSENIPPQKFQARVVFE